MKKAILLPVYCLFVFIALPYTIFPQDKQSIIQDKQHSIQGVWTEVFSGSNGKNHLLEGMKMRVNMSVLETTATALQPFLSVIILKISKDVIEEGFVNNPCFPHTSYYYKLDLGDIVGAIDMIILDKKGQKGKAKVKGIYYLKDDILIICITGGENPRPEQFSASPNSKNCLKIYMRGNWNESKK